MESIHNLVQMAATGPDYSYHFGERNTTGWIKRLFESYCRMFLFRIYCPVISTGKQHLPDSSFLLCSNHSSHMDSVALMVASGKPFGRFGMMAAMDYFFENKTRKVFLNEFMNLIPIKRQPSIHEVVDAIIACRQFIQDSHRAIIIFPEGTRSLSGQLLPFKKGAAMIAIELGIPIIPAYIRGTRDAMPKGRGFIRPGKIIVSIGRALDPANYIDHSCNGRFNKSYRYLTRELESKIHRLKEVSGLEN